MSKAKPVKPRLGKKASDLFQRTDNDISRKEKHIPAIEETQPESQHIEVIKAQRGRPQVHEEKWTKVTTVLFDNQIHWLDTLAANIRLKTRAAVSRAELIRAMIAATEESGIDLSDVSSEQEIKSLLLEKLRK